MQRVRLLNKRKLRRLTRNAYFHWGISVYWLLDNAGKTFSAYKVGHAINEDIYRMLDSRTDVHYHLPSSVLARVFKV